MRLAPMKADEVRRSRCTDANDTRVSKYVEEFETISYHNSKAHLVLSSGKTSFKTEDESLALSSLIPLSEPIEAVPQQSRMMNQYAGNEIWMKRLMIDAFTKFSAIAKEVGVI